MALSVGVGLGVGGGLYLGGDAAKESAGDASRNALGVAGASELTLLYALTAADRIEAARAQAESDARAETGAGERKAPEAVSADSPPPAWRRYAVPVPPHPIDAPRVAIVIDDLGVNRAAARQALDLPAPMTLSFMTYAPAPAAVAQEARAAGHELMLHVPMEPHDDSVDPGPKVLRGEQTQTELLGRLDWGLSRISEYVGINNHMGSKFTADEAAMRIVLEELRERGLLFLDSMTGPDSLGQSLAAEIGVPHAARDVFLDNDRDPAAIRTQLEEVERIARSRGSAIAIGHPYEETYEVLHDWVPDARARGIVLVPVSALITAPEGADRDLVEARE